MLKRVSTVPLFLHASHRLSSCVSSFCRCVLYGVLHSLLDNAVRSEGMLSGPFDSHSFAARLLHIVFHSSFDPVCPGCVVGYMHSLHCHHPSPARLPSLCLPVFSPVSAFDLSLLPHLLPPSPPARTTSALASFSPPSLAGPRSFSTAPPASPLPRLHPLLPLLFQCHISERDARFAPEAIAREKLALGFHEPAIPQIRAEFATDCLRSYGVQLPPQHVPRSCCSARHFFARREDRLLLRLRSASTCQCESLSPPSLPMWVFRLYVLLSPASLSPL
eukprot:5833148-Pleurochrysis_carterae.AAC.1